MRNLSVLLLCGSMISSAYAIDSIPQESGFSGFVNIGAGAANIESNTLAKTLFGSVDLGDNNLDSLYQSPDSETTVIPVVGLEVAYTFASTRTQVFMGNQLEDYLRFDFATRAGIRQEIGKAGVLGLNLLQSPIATEVWEDPFVTDSGRISTDRTSSGYRLIWDKIFGTELQLRYSAKEVDIDDERSGQAEGLSPEERSLLNRNGDINRFYAEYTFNWSNNQHRLTPSIAYADQDLDGAAVAYDSLSLSVNYIYLVNRWRYVINGSYADNKFNEENPVYGQKADSQRYGGSFTVFYYQPFAWKDWLVNAGIVWFEEDSDINFYDSSAQSLSIGMLRRF